METAEDREYQAAKRKWEEREPHPVVRLLLDRMASNPEEFSTFLPNGARWGRILTEVTRWAPKEDRDAIEEAQRAIILEKLHGQMMEELLNPAPEPGARNEIPVTLTGQTNRTAAAQAALAAHQAGMQRGQLNPYNQTQLGGTLTGVFK